MKRITFIYKYNTIIIKHLYIEDRTIYSKYTHKVIYFFLVPNMENNIVFFYIRIVFYVRIYIKHRYKV